MSGNTRLIGIEDARFEPNFRLCLMLRYDIDFWPDRVAAEEAIRLVKIVRDILSSATNGFT